VTFAVNIDMIQVYNMNAPLPLGLQVMQAHSFPVMVFDITRRPNISRPPNADGRQSNTGLLMAGVEGSKLIARVPRILQRFPDAVRHLHPFFVLLTSLCIPPLSVHPPFYDTFQFVFRVAIIASVNVTRVLCRTPRSCWPTIHHTTT